MEQQSRRKKVLCPVKNEKNDKTFWLNIGAAFTNRDGSTNVYLDAYPTNGRLQIRDFDDREKEGGGPSSPRTSSDAIPF